jgi:hypothetical protein
VHIAHITPKQASSLMTNCKTQTWESVQPTWNDHGRLGCLEQRHEENSQSTYRVSTGAYNNVFSKLSHTV